MKTHRGRLITFIGIDGSGKSTLAQNIHRQLLERQFPARYVWGAYELLLLRPLVRTFRNKIASKANPGRDYQGYHSSLLGLGEKKGLFRLYLSAVLLEYYLESLITIQTPLWAGRVVVADRYIFDTATHLAANYGFTAPEHKDLIARMLKVWPRPDLTFWVDVPEETAMARKDDIPALDYIRIRRRFYQNIHENFPVIRLDGRESPEELAAQVARYLAAHLWVEA
jgi:dTMP kinase